MALTAASMAQKIVTNIKTKNPEITGAAETAMIDYWTLISQGVIDEIVQNSIVAVPGITPGPGSTTGTIS